MVIRDARLSARPRIRGRVTIVASLLLLLLADSARASSFVCSALGAAKDFSVLGTKKVLMTPGSSVGELEGRPPETGAVCSRQETLTVAFVSGDVVATNAKGTAIAFRRAPASNENADSVVGGGVVTGGGRVHLTGHEQFSFLDTTGTHPDVASCSAALADTAAASSAFAALPPTMTLGDVFVPPDPSSSVFVDIDATGGPQPVLNFHSLRLADAPSNCWLISESGGLLRINTDPGAEVVINVATNFHLGNCALIDLSGADRAVVNVVGKGPQIIVGQSAILSFHMALLAPQRNVVTLDGFGEATDINQVWGQSVTLKGHNHVFSPMCQGASPSGAFIDGPVAY